MDANRDGIFEALDITDKDIETQFMPAGAGLGEKRGLLEFNIECVGPNPTALSASLQGYVNLLQGSGVGVSFLGYVGDGELTLSDATASTTQVGSISNASLGAFSISIDAGFVQNVASSARVVGLTSRMLAGQRLFIDSTDASWASPPPTLVISYTTSGTNAPIAKPGGPYPISEGDSLTLDASGSCDADGDALTYAWDLDDDGQFDDATGPSPNLTWAQLVGFGIDDNGTFSISVQVSDGSISSTGAADLVVSNRPPALTIGGVSAADEGALYTLNISSSDPGDDTITAWSINWGDGSTTIEAGNPSSVTHVYADGPASQFIRATATDEDGIWTAYPNGNVSGALDTGFGSGGQVRFSFPGFSFSHATDVAIQSDGKILVAGAVYSSEFDQDCAVARFNPDGALDTTFGNGGHVVTNLGSAFDWANAVVIQNDGKIVVGGQTHDSSGRSNFALVRYHSDGSLDTTFDADGIVQTSFGSSDRVNDLALLPDGRILAAGYAIVADVVDWFAFALALYNSDGSLDTSFGTGGKATARFGSEADAVPYAVGVQQDGRIVLAGYMTSYGPQGEDFAVARFNSDGALDSSFGVDGRVTLDWGSNGDQGRGVVIQADGRIVVGGTVATNSNFTQFNFALTRLDAIGNLDPSFGSGGRVTTDFRGPTSHDQGRNLVMDEVGRLILAGYSLDHIGGTNNNFALARYTANGALDDSFGVGGKSTTDFSNRYDDAYAVAIQADGRIVLAGISSDLMGNSTDFAVARYYAEWLEVRVNDVPPTLTITGPGSVDQGTSYTLSLSSGDPGADTIDSWSINWGDGAAQTIPGNPSSVTHVYTAAPSSYVISATATNEDGNYVSNTQEVTVNRVTPTLDPTFGNGGIVTTDFLGESSDVPSDIALQPDGKLIVVGSTESAVADADFAVARFNSDGTLDSSFGIGGRVATDFGALEKATSVAIDSSNRIVVTGYSGTNLSTWSSFAVARYNSDGTLDTTFGAGGKVITPISSWLDLPNKILIDPSGRIIVVGTADVSSTDSDFAVVRYNSDGTLDGSFDGDGKLITDFDNSDDFAHDALLDPLGRLIVAGSSRLDFGLARYNADGTLDSTFGGDGLVTAGIAMATSDVAVGVALDSANRIVAVGFADSDFAVARFTSGGSLDTSFGGDGTVTTSLSSWTDQARAVLIDSSDRIIAAGSVGAACLCYDFAVVRYNTDGSLDSTFDGDGKVTVDFATTMDSGSAMLFDLSGRIVVAGETRIDNFSANFGVVRLDAAGALDTSFGTGGKVSADLLGSAHDSVYDIVLQPDGKTIAVGMRDVVDNGRDFALARYNSDGTLDATFGSGGRVTTDFDGKLDIAWGATLDAAGRIVVAGESGADMAIARYMSDGTLDSTFGTGGRVVVSILSGSDSARTVVVDGLGRILVGGYARHATHGDFALLRLNENGTVDTSFDGDGKVVTDFAGSSDEFFGRFVLTGTGAIVAVGNSTPGAFTARNFAVAVYRADGSLDTSFDGDGKVTTDIAGNADFAASVVVDGAGRIVVAGNALNGSTWDFALVRYLVNGTLDSAFDGDGRVTTDFGGIDFATDLLIDAAGGIIAAGHASSPSTGRNFALARYNDAGGLDPRFGGGGKVTTDLAAGDDYASTMAIDADRRLLVAGESPNVRRGRDFALARFLTNSPPIADAGPDQTVNEGSAVSFDGTNSNDPDGDALSYSWDFGDGTTETGANVTHVYADDGVFIVTLTVDDGNEHTAIDSLVVTVNNVAPIVGPINGPTPNPAVPGQIVRFAGSFADPGTSDAHEVSWNFGDGTGIPFHPVSDPDSLEPTHIFTASGTYSVELSVRDNDGSVGSSTTQVLVASVALQDDPVLAGQQALVVGGTIGNDTIQFSVGVPATNVEVKINGVSQGQYAFGGRIIVYAQAGNDSVQVPIARNAELHGDAGNDTLTAGDGLDTLLGGLGNDSLVGNLAADLLSGDDDNDTMLGGAGDDTYVFDTDVPLGSDMLNESGGGLDTLDFSPSSLGVTVNLALATAQTVNANLTLNLLSASKFEAVIGGDGPDSITGNTLSNTLTGAAGNDTITGSSGNDVYLFDTDTNLGSDVLNESGGGSDTLDFSATSSLAVSVNLATATAQTVNANLTLHLQAANRFEAVTGGALGDTLTGNTLGNTIVGGPGDDTMIGSTGSDVYRFVVGGLGTDWITEAANLDSDTLDFAMFGFDVVISLSVTTTQVVSAGNLALTLSSGVGVENVTGGSGADNIIGNSRNNSLRGGAGNDTLVGGAGNDTFAGQAGDDSLTGDTGNDTYQFAGTGVGSDVVVEAANLDTDALDFTQFSVGATINIASAAAQVVSSGHLTLTLSDAAGIENVLGGAGIDTFTGNSRNNSLTGGSGNDTIFGGIGNDTLVGAAGNDSLIGDAGDDTYLFDADASLGSDTIDESGGGLDTLNFSATTTRTVTIDLSIGTAQPVNAFLTLNLQSAVTLERAVGSSLGDTIIGNSLANMMTGGPGNDTLSGGAGNDTYVFDADSALGSDTLDESAGGIDTLDFSATTGKSVTVNLANGLAQPINVNLTLTLGSDGTFENVISGGLGDTITGNALANTLSGGSGNDTLTGAAGDDSLTGGAGNDTYLFDTDSALGTDSLNESGGGIDTLDFSATTTQSIVVALSNPAAQSISANLNLNLQSGAAFEHVIGGALGDTITGNALANNLNGAAGDDLLTGGAGNDTITGGSDTDRLVESANVSFTLTNTSLVGLGTDSLSGIEQARLTGGVSNNTLNASAFSGSTTLDGGVGNDSLVGGSGADSLIGSDGNDTLSAGNGGDVLAGGLGNDSLVGGDGDDTLDGGQGNDTLTGGLGADLWLFQGTSGADDLRVTNQTATQLKATRASVGSGTILETDLFNYDAVDEVLIQALDQDDLIDVALDVPLDGTIDGGAGSDTGNAPANWTKVNCEF